MSDELPGDTVLPVGTAGLLKRPVSSANGPFPPRAENGEQMHHPSATNPPKPYSALRPPCQRHGRDQVALGEEAVIGGPSWSARGPPGQPAALATILVRRQEGWRARVPEQLGEEGPVSPAAVPGALILSDLHPGGSRAGEPARASPHSLWRSRRVYF